MYVCEHICVYTYIYIYIYIIIYRDTCITTHIHTYMYYIHMALLLGTKTASTARATRATWESPRLVPQVGGIKIRGPVEDISMMVNNGL